MLYLFIIIILLVIIIYFSLLSIHYKNIEILKKNLYNIAKNRSIVLNKPLLVIGAPNDLESYGCGNICIDLNGCPLCNVSIKNKVEDEIKNYHSNSYIIYECGVLEVVDDPRIIKEMYRIAGSKENIFSFHHLKNTLYTNILQKIYKYRGEGNIQRVVVKYPPENYYVFENII
jgi:hypothetical protein